MSPPQKETFAGTGAQAQRRRFHSARHCLDRRSAADRPARSPASDRRRRRTALPAGRIASIGRDHRLVAIRRLDEELRRAGSRHRVDRAPSAARARAAGSVPAGSRETRMPVRSSPTPSARAGSPTGPTSGTTGTPARCAARPARHPDRQRPDTRRRRRAPRSWPASAGASSAATRLGGVCSFNSSKHAIDCSGICGRERFEKLRARSSAFRRRNGAGCARRRSFAAAAPRPAPRRRAGSESGRDAPASGVAALNAPSASKRPDALGEQHVGEADQRQADQRRRVVAGDAREQRDAERFRP